MSTDCKFVCEISQAAVAFFKISLQFATLPVRIKRK